MRSYFYLLLISFAVLYSCNEEITVGSSIIEDTSIQVGFTDTVNISLKSIIDDSVEVYRVNFNRRTYLLGEFDDPQFGNSKADLYLSTGLLNTSFPVFDSLKIDSVVMVLQLDTLGQYGNEEAIHNIEVFQLEEEFIPGDDNVIYASEQFAFNPMPAGQISNTLKHRDSLDVYIPIGDTIRRVGPQLRVKLDTNVWSTVARDTLISQDSELFSSTVKGYLVKSQTSDNSFAGFNLSNDGISAIEFYFSNNENTQDSVFLFDVGLHRSNYYNHNYSGSTAGQAIDVETDQEVYIQGMQGLNIEVDLSNVVDFADKIINKATLSMFVLQDANPILPEAEEIRVYYKNANGATVQTIDSAIPLSSIDFLDGDLKEIVIGGQTLKKYDINITNHVIGIIRGNIDNTKIILKISDKASHANRSVLLGISHPDFPTQLKMITSKP